MKTKLLIILIFISFTRGCISEGTEQVQNLVEQHVEQVDTLVQEETPVNNVPEDTSNVSTTSEEDNQINIPLHLMKL